MIVNAKKQIFAVCFHFEGSIDDRFQVEISACAERLDLNGVRLVILVDYDQLDQRFDVHLNNSIGDELFDTLADLIRSELNQKSVPFGVFNSTVTISSHCLDQSIIHFVNPPWT